MPRRTPIATRELLKQIPLPQHATSYTVIEHETVIVNTLDQLKLKGFTVDQEHYRMNNSGEVALGVYHLNYKNDPELGMMFAWANSYDKTMRFKCAVGGFIRVSGSSMIGDDFSWSRKHTGTADQEMIAQVTNQITNGQIYYDNLLLVRDEMKQMMVTEIQMAEFLGRAFFNQDLFSKEQIGIVRDEMQHPSYDYNTASDTLWAYYNHMLVALKKAHPRTWMDEQLELHKAVCKEFNLTTNSGTFALTLPQVVVKVLSNEPVETPEGFVYTVEVVKDQNPEGLPVLDLTPESNFKTTVTSPDEQELINQRMALLNGGKKEEIMDLNLPD